MGIEVLSQLRCLGAKGSPRIGIAAVTVKLDVRQMPAVAFERFHRLQRRGPVPWNSQVVAVNVDRMRQTEFARGLRNSLNDLSGRDIEMGNDVVDPRGVPA